MVGGGLWWEPHSGHENLILGLDVALKPEITYVSQLESLIKVQNNRAHMLGFELEY